jgi:predicted transcriptional regulator
MTRVVETVQVAAIVPKNLAADLRDLARASERSTAAEIRLAIKAWVDTQKKAQAA